LPRAIQSPKAPPPLDHRPYPPDERPRPEQATENGEHEGSGDDEAYNSIFLVLLATLRMPKA
jgi:hypothetical protein